MGRTALGLNVVRGLAVWLAAPLMASLLCTLAWSVLLGGEMATPRVAVSIGLGSFFFTLIGSALISGLFAGMRARPIRHRYLIVVGLSGLIGSATMLILGGPPTPSRRAQSTA
jgi:hypothetical protein